MYCPRGADGHQPIYKPRKIKTRIDGDFPRREGKIASRLVPQRCFFCALWKTLDTSGKGLLHIVNSGLQTKVRTPHHAASSAGSGFLAAPISPSPPGEKLQSWEAATKGPRPETDRGPVLHAGHDADRHPASLIQWD